MVSLETAWFDLLFGLPLHPLVVHGAVVLVPLAGLALVIEVMAPKLADRFAGITLILLTVGVGFTFVAKESGKALAARVGDPGLHASLGDLLPWGALALWLVALIWYLLRLRRKGEPHGTLLTVIGLILTVLALTVTIATVAVGHTGAAAVWEVAPTPSPVPSSTPSPTLVPTPGVTDTGPQPTAIDVSTAYTLTEVAEHADANSCWTAIDGKVYDLTEWIPLHPGGSDKILALCGTDGSAAFTQQHSGQAKPAEELAMQLIGTLK